MSKSRCDWAGTDPLMIHYHDHEWGLPLYDERKLFEFLILEGMQAGLSWSTILKKRENYRAAFENFDPVRIAQYDTKKFNALMKNEGIIRNQLKIQSIITNARAYLEVNDFSDYIWSFVDGKPILNHWKKHSEVPAQTSISDAMAKDLKRKGFKFVGSTICYAFMQATGMVNDHLTSCSYHTKSTV